MREGCSGFKKVNNGFQWKGHWKSIHQLRRTVPTSGEYRYAILNPKKYSVFKTPRKYPFGVKGTVQRDGSRYKSGINRKVFLKGITSKA